MKSTRLSHLSVGAVVLVLASGAPVSAQPAPDAPPAAPADTAAATPPPPTPPSSPTPPPPTPAPAPTPPAPTPASPPTDDEADEAEERAIAAELAALKLASPDPPAAPPSARQATQPSGSAMNPAISANGLLLAGLRSEDPRTPGELETGMHLQEVELRLSSVVDPYLRADLTLAANGHGIGFEEAYISTLEIPRLTIRAGQIYAAMGRHNQLHTHAFPFLTAPLPSRALFGEEGLKDPGISLDALVPLPFYAELSAQVFQGEWLAFASTVEGNSDPDGQDAAGEQDLREDHDFVYLAHLRTLFELGEDTTVELGGSYAGGRNGFGKRSDLLGGDLTLKWRPLSAERYTGIDWSTEYIWVQRRGARADNRVGGGFSGLRVQFDQRFWVQGRAALLGLPEDDTPRSYRAEALFAFIPSEFSALRLQYAYETTEAAAAPDVHELFLQAIFSIGPHPPHDY